MEVVDKKIKKIKQQYANLNNKEVNTLRKIILILEIRDLLESSVYSPHLNKTEIKELNDIIDYLQRESVKNT